MLNYAKLAMRCYGLKNSFGFLGFLASLSREEKTLSFHVVTDDYDDR